MLDWLMKLFSGKEVTLPEEDEEISVDDLRNRLEAESSGIPAQVLAKIRQLVDEGNQHYPHSDPRRAYGLFRDAMKIAPDATGSVLVDEGRDLSELGHAVWAAWVCTDLMDGGYDLDEFMVEAERVSPATVARIDARRTENASQQVDYARWEEALDVVFSSFDDGRVPERDTVNNLVEAGNGREAWWDLRDVGARLSKKGAHDLAWMVLNSALTVGMKKNGNLASIYEVMGDVCKREGKHRDAARQYLLACASCDGQPTKRAFDQVRISLKKAGMKRDADTARDELVEMAGTKEIREVLSRMDELLRDVAE